MARIGFPFEEIKEAVVGLLAYCQEENWEGYDPYDALNCSYLAWLPLLDFRIPRLLLTQFLKRSPVNLRPVLRIPRVQNSKAIALFLMAVLKLTRLGLLKDQTLIKTLADKLGTMRANVDSYYCWGYSFPWQTRELLVPRGAPNIVCTVFAANALLDTFESTRVPAYLEMASSAAEYILNELYWVSGEFSAGFRYPSPSVRTHVYNASFLGAALLCRVFCLTGDQRFLGPALKAARYSASKQNSDGSWTYGESARQKWIDNFHTGYNLVALNDINTYGQTAEFSPFLRRGFDYYKKHFLAADGAPNYFHNRYYPIDIHCVAQSIITLLALKGLDQRNLQASLAIFRWAISHMRSEDGHFYYQVHPLYTNKISYMRWSQSWMLLALSTLLAEQAEATLSLPPLGRHQIDGKSR